MKHNAVTITSLLALSFLLGKYLSDFLCLEKNYDFRISFLTFIYAFWTFLLYFFIGKILRIQKCASIKAFILLVAFDILISHYSDFMLTALSNL